MSLLSYANSRDQTGRRLNIRLICVLLSMMGSWAGFFLVLLMPEHLPSYLPVYTFSLLSVPVALYVYIRFYVRIGKPEDSQFRKFARFLFPFSAAVATLLFPDWSEMVRTASGVSGISWLSLLVSVMYIGLTMRTVWLYYRQRRRDEGMTLVLTRRFSWLMGLLLLNIVIMVYRNFYGDTIVSIPAIVGSAFCFSVITGVLLHHVLRRDFLMFHKKVDKKTDLTQFAERRREAASRPPANDFSPAIPEVLSRKVVEQYFFKYRVYLDPGLTISMLAERLQTNRTYLSGFINKEYGMNFRSYLNAVRLKELERLKSLPSNERVLLRTLVRRAGFGSYGGYLRAKKLLYDKEEGDE